jgi:hypothetical protein
MDKCNEIGERGEGRVGRGEGRGEKVEGGRWRVEGNKEYTKKRNGRLFYRNAHFNLVRLKMVFILYQIHMASMPVCPAYGSSG